MLGEVCRVQQKTASRQGEAELSDNHVAWTVIGGESGSKKESRVMTLEDARYLFASSRAAGAKVHFKKLGTQLARQMRVYATGEHRSKGGKACAVFAAILPAQNRPLGAAACCLDKTGF